MTIDKFSLEQLTDYQGFDAHWFLPFIIHRLRPIAINRQIDLTVSLQNILSESLVNRQLRLTWSVESENIGVPPVQENVITEWAACGIACIILPLYTGLRMLHVTQSGDGFDYWVGNRNEEFGLEISGTLAGNLNQRHRLKIRQLLNSPHHVAGYVCVVSFQAKQAILSSH